MTISNGVKIKPLGDRILVKPHTSEEVTKSGIVLPESAEKEQKEQGEVVAIGGGPKNKKPPPQNRPTPPFFSKIYFLLTKPQIALVFGNFLLPFATPIFSPPILPKKDEIDKVQYKFLKDEDVLWIVEK